MATNQVMMFLHTFALIVVYVIIVSIFLNGGFANFAKKLVDEIDMKFEKIICINIGVFDNESKKYDEIENILIKFMKDECKRMDKTYDFFSIEHAKLISSPMSPPMVAFKDGCPQYSSAAIKIVWMTDENEKKHCNVSRKYCEVCKNEKVACTCLGDGKD